MFKQLADEVIDGRPVFVIEGTPKADYAPQLDEAKILKRVRAKFWIDKQEIVVHAGEVLCIPANMPHKAEAMEDTVDLDIFTPPRADWINKTDQYLRKEK